MKLRFQITKEKSIRFISHLEYMRALERAIKRAKIPVAYSQGFNPHMKFSLASALGVGVVSYAEFMELTLEDDVDVDPVAAACRLAATLPGGIRLIAMDAVENKTKALMAAAGGAEYRITLPWRENWEEALAAFNRAEKVEFSKPAPKGKKRIRVVPVKFYIHKVEGKEVRDAKDNRCVELHFHCRITPTGSMKAIELVKVLNEMFNMDFPLEQADVERLDLYKQDEEGNRSPMLDNLYKEEKAVEEKAVEEKSAEEKATEVKSVEEKAVNVAGEKNQ